MNPTVAKLEAAALEAQNKLDAARRAEAERQETRDSLVAKVAQCKARLGGADREIRLSETRLFELDGESEVQWLKNEGLADHALEHSRRTFLLEKCKVWKEKYQQQLAEAEAALKKFDTAPTRV